MVVNLKKFPHCELVWVYLEIYVIFCLKVLPHTTIHTYKHETQPLPLGGEMVNSKNVISFSEKLLIAFKSKLQHWLKNFLEKESERERERARLKAFPLFALVKCFPFQKKNNNNKGGKWMWSEWEKSKIIIQANLNNFCNAKNFPNSKNPSNIPHHPTKIIL